MALTFDPPIHPGEILREEFLSPLGLSPYQLAKRLGVPRTRIERIVGGKTGITADTALRLGRAFETTPNFWLNLQANYDLAVAGKAKQDELAAIEAIKAA